VPRKGTGHLAEEATKRFPSNVSLVKRPLGLRCRPRLHPKLLEEKREDIRLLGDALAERGAHPVAGCAAEPDEDRIRRAGRGFAGGRSSCAKLAG